MTQYSTSEYIHKETQNTILKRYLYLYVQSSIIDNSQDMKASQVSIDGIYSAIKRMKSYYL